METVLFVGTYSRRGSRGIYSCALDRDMGAIRVLSTTPVENASFLALTPGGKTLLACLEVGEITGVEGAGLASYRIGANGELSPLSVVNIGAKYACHVAVSPDGRFAATSQYGGGAHTMVPIGADGTLGVVAAFVENRGVTGHKPAQDAPHAHSAWFSPDGSLLVCCDLGLDTLFVRRVNPETGALTLVSETRLSPGSGPRHFAWSPNLAGVGYVVNEHGSTVMRLHLSNETLVVEQTVPTLPPDLQAQAEAGTYPNACADIRVSADGRFVYASNRGHDSLASYAVGKNGDLTLLGHVPCGGEHPRNFSLVPGTDLLLCANQDSDTVTVFRIGADGVPVATGAVSELSAPVCLLVTEQTVNQ
ncbi:MAG: lactonase family protein [Armatimonadetes bacterium]|nr:lactonase family protein [Armatimonadota bacterium]